MGRGGHFGLLSCLDCFRQSGHAVLPRQWQATGCWSPRLWLFGASAHRAGPFLNYIGSSQVLSLAVCTYSGRPERGKPPVQPQLGPATGHQKGARTPTPARVGRLSRERVADGTGNHRRGEVLSD